jgi:hypothetical protein
MSCLDPDRVIGDSGSGWDARYRPVLSPIIEAASGGVKE